MRKIFAVSIAVGVALGAVPSEAADNLSSLRAIKLGRSFPGDLLECPIDSAYGLQTYIPAMASNFPESAKGKPCFGDRSLGKDRSGHQWFVDNLAFVKGSGTDADVTVIGGKIEKIRVSFFNSEAATLLGALKAKYGVPTQEKSESFHNGYGAMFTGDVATWARDGSFLVFHEYDVSEGKDHGYIQLMSAAYMQSLDATVQDETKAARDGL